MSLHGFGVRLSLIRQQQWGQTQSGSRWKVGKGSQKWCMHEQSGRCAACALGGTICRGACSCIKAVVGRGVHVHVP
jgi:predicted metal-dependent hydrolase